VTDSAVVVALYVHQNNTSATHAAAAAAVPQIGGSTYIQP